MVGPQLSAVPWFDSGGWARMSDTASEQALAYVREHYQRPAHVGARVTVDGNPGVIVGGQNAHLVVDFGGYTVPCHPTWRVEYLTSHDTPPSGPVAASGPLLDLGGPGPCLECDSPHLFGERCAPELDGPSSQTTPSDHGSCGHELDPWETHLEHHPDCPRELCLEDRCDCPEVCPDCCRACGYDLAERMGS